MQSLGKSQKVLEVGHIPHQLRGVAIAVRHINRHINQAISCSYAQLFRLVSPHQHGIDDTLRGGL